MQAPRFRPGRASSGNSLNDRVRVNANEITIDNVSFVENGVDGLEIQSPNQPTLGDINCLNNGAYAIRVTA